MLSTPTGQQAGVADDRRAARNLRAFRLIWVTQLVARVGNGMTAFGLGVFVYQETGQTTPARSSC